mmetsp:Transcript_40790/g.127630  ORF Transcript_40790/g.127630 Transcript_40790/m.127630 type:complete len:286 (-) Transcript_40790:3166-4023(-)
MSSCSSASWTPLRSTRPTRCSRRRSSSSPARTPSWSQVRRWTAPQPRCGALYSHTHLALTLTLILGKRFTVNSCKLIFAKVKLRNKTAIAFDTYRRALHMVADDKGLQYQDVVETMISLGGPVPEPDAEAAPAAAAGESSNEGDVSAFAGTWHVERHETLDDFLKLMGAGWAARKAVGSQHPNHTITVTPGAVRIVVGGLLASDNTYPLDGTSIHTTSRGHDYEDYVDTSDGKLAIHKLRLEDGLRITLVKAFADGSGEVLTQTTTALKTDGTTATTTTWLSRAN